MVKCFAISSLVALAFVAFGTDTATCESKVEVDQLTDWEPRKPFFASCVALDREFSVEVEPGLSGARAIKFQYESDKTASPIIKLSKGKNSDGVSVIVAKASKIQIVFPARWYGKNFERLEKVDDAHGWELSEVVTVLATNQTHIGWDFCSVKTKSSEIPVQK